MDAAAFVRDQLAEVRLFVGFVAPRAWPRAELRRWPTTWIRDDAGAWHPLELGRSHRARQLLTLLAVFPDGLNGPTANAYFDSEPDDGPRMSPSGPRDERAKSALGTLRSKLADNGIADVSHLLVVPPGHRRSSPWRLEQVRTDVQIAVAATGPAEQWSVAWSLLHGGAGDLVGVPRARAGTRRRVPPHLGLSSPQRHAMRTGVLPEALIEAAAAATRATLYHFAGPGSPPPPVSPTVVAEMLAAVSPGAVRDPDDVGRAAIVGDGVRDPADGGALVPVGHGALDEPSGAEEMVAPIHPLTVAARTTARRRWLAPAGVGVGLVTAAVAVAVLLVTGAHPGRAVAPASADAMPLTARDGRLEVQTYVSDANSFVDPRRLDGRIERIPAGSTVLVACREYIPGPRSFAPYWWYHLVWPRAGRWVPANSFLNGDPASDYLGPHPHPPRHQHSVDASVAVCRSDGPGGTVAVPRTGSVSTFADPASGRGAGPAITGRRRVVVSCRVASGAPASEPGGVAYRIASAPWDHRYYAPARAFRNAIPADSPSPELVDPGIPLCPG